MAGTTTKNRITLARDSVERQMAIQINNIITDLETLRANSDMIARNRVMNNAAIAIGTTVQKVKTVNSISFAINGALFTKAGTDDLWTLSGTTIADGFANKYLLCLNSSGTASIVEGTQAATAGAVTLPSLPADKAVVGVLTVATAGATFVPGTTALNAGTVTATYTNGLDSGYFSAGASALVAAAIANEAGTSVTSL